MLARKILEHECKRTFGIVVTLSLIGFLLFQQFGSVLGRWESLGAFEREFRADYVVYLDPPSATFVKPLASPLPDWVGSRVSLHPDVEKYEYITLGSRYIRLPNMPFTDRGARKIIVQQGQIPLNYPRDLPDDLVGAVSGLGAIMITSDLADRFSFELGQTIEMEGQELKISAIAEKTRPYESVVMMSGNTQNLLSKRRSASRVREVSGIGVVNLSKPYGLLVELKKGVDVLEVGGELRGLVNNRNVKIVSPREVSSETSLSLLFEESSNRSFLITALFTVLISCLIATQTMRSAILAHEDEFAILLALGVSVMSVRLISLEIAFLLGLLSATFATAVSFFMKVIFSKLGLLFSLSVELSGFVFILIMLISLFSGFLASFAVTKIEPSKLFR